MPASFPRFIASLGQHGDGRNTFAAVSHLRQMLGREPRFSDLNERKLSRLLCELSASDRKSRTVLRYQKALMAICVAAHKAGRIKRLPELPVIPQPTATESLTSEQLSLLFAAARHTKGYSGSVPLSAFLPALFALTLDTSASLNTLMRAEQDRFDGRLGVLKLDGQTHRLQPNTIEALKAVVRFREDRLLPWPFDGQRPPYSRLYRTIREVAHQADIGRRVQIIRALRRTDAVAIQQIDQFVQFTPRSGSSRRRSTPRPQRYYRLQPLSDERTLMNVFSRSFERLQLVDAAEASAEKYKCVINRFSWYLASEATLENLTDDTLQEFFAWLKAAGRSNATINGYRACLLALWRHAWRKRMLDELPHDVPKLREPKRLPKAWSLTEFERILTAAGKQPGEVAGISSSQWWRSLLLVAFDTGLRISALLQTRVADLDVEAGVLFIAAEHQKQDADQVFALHADTRSLIALTAPFDREWLFPWPHGMRELRECYREILKTSGLPHGKKDLFHKLRRTSGTYLARATDAATAQSHLGHSSMAVTARSYLDPRMLNRVQAAMVMERPRLLEATP